MGTNPFAKEALNMERTASSESAGRARPSGGDEQLWPIVCATVVLVGILSVIVYYNSDFDEDRFFWNGYTHFVALGIAAALLIFISSRLKGAARRTAELAIIMSLVIHAAGGVGAYYMFANPITSGNLPGEIHDQFPEGDDGGPLPDYRWAQNEEEQPEQAFEKVVPTTIREQAPPAAQLQPWNLERPLPTAEIPRLPKPETAPLAVEKPLVPSPPLSILRPDAAKPAETKPEALAMARQKSDELTLPKAEAPAPVAASPAAQESPKTLDAAAVSVEKSKFDGATASKEPVSASDLATRGAGAPAQSLPTADLVARLPSLGSSQTPKSPSGPAAVDQLTSPGSTLERSDRGGAPLPSTAIADAGPSGQSPAAVGGSLPRRLDALSTGPIEKSDTSRSPIGPGAAAGGNQDSGRGSIFLPARRGAVDGRGDLQPSIEGNTPGDFGEFRPGAPGSNLKKGWSLPVGPARRSTASPSADVGLVSDGAAGSRLPRTQSEIGLSLPAAAKISVDTASSGGGGGASRSAGLASSLDVGQQIAIRRSASSVGVPRDRAGGAGTAGTDGGEMFPGTAEIARGSMGGSPSGQGGPRRIGQGGSGTGTLGTGTLGAGTLGAGTPGRARSEIGGPRLAAIPMGPSSGNPNGSGSGPGSGAGGRGRGGASQGFGDQSLGPSVGASGIGRSERTDGGVGVGVRGAGSVEPTEIPSQEGIASLQPSAGTVRGRGGDGQLDELLSFGGTGNGGSGRGSGDVVVSGKVREPMEAFRRGAVRGGLVLGDSAGGQLSEPAIESGLEYFSQTQFGDGHWSLHEMPEGMTADPATLGNLHADTAATGLALLTYLGAGYTHQDDKYRDVVRRGVGWLIKHQQPDGNLSYQGSEPTHYYSHGIATTALCEAYGMTQDRALREAAQRAVDFIVRSQDPRRGGWRYRSQEGSDTSVTGWQLVALTSAQMAHLDVAEETLRKVSHWLDLAQVPNRGTYVYNPWNSDSENPLGRAPNPTMTAQAMIMRMYLGQERQNASLVQGADYLLSNLPERGSVEVSKRDCYYWYYATQAMYRMQGDYWKTWKERILPLLRADQVDRGPLKGSWSPREPVPDRWSAHGGRHYVTSMHILTLEFPYWHLPLFRELRKE
jgi:hypothetical protein